MNKFQEAFETIKNSLPPKLVEDSRYKTYKAITTIQELIDNYKSLREDYMSYEDLKAEYETKINKLEKALYKAIDDIENYSGSCPNDTYDKDYDCKNICHNQYHECWEKYYLEESEKENDK